MNSRPWVRQVTKLVALQTIVESKFYISSDQNYVNCLFFKIE